MEYLMIPYCVIPKSVSTCMCITRKMEQLALTLIVTNHMPRGGPDP